MTRVVVTGHRNGIVWRYADKQWGDIGVVRYEQSGERRWRAFPVTGDLDYDFGAYCEATNRAAAVRKLLSALGIPEEEWRP